MRDALVVSIAAVFLFSTAHCAVAADEITAEQVVKAIDRGVEYLKRKQSNRGSGPTCWAIPTARRRSVRWPFSTPACRRAIRLSKRRSPICVRSSRRERTRWPYRRWSCARPSQNETWCSSNGTFAGWKRRRSKRGNRIGSWAYPGKDGDNSNAQFAVLALHEAERAGVDVESANVAASPQLLEEGATGRRVVDLQTQRTWYRAA